MNKLATLGSVEEILAIGHFLPTKIKKDVSFDNRLCNAYLSAGRGSEFLEVLVQDLALAARFSHTYCHLVLRKFLVLRSVTTVHAGLVILSSWLL